jgi:UDP-N-acetylglucosamine:LPS N-acetylglucosamine transferase
MSANTNIHICLVASAGGHMSQLLRLTESWKGHDIFCVTTSDVARIKLKKYGKVYIVGECNRQHPIRAAKVLMRCMRVVIKERPEVVISTGAAAGCMVCIIGKLFGAKVVWIDSIANVSRLSLSGRIVKPFADLFLTQWPELASESCHVYYVGAIV